MLDLSRQSVAEQIGGAPIHACGVSVRVLDPARQMLVTGEHGLAVGAVTAGDPYSVWLRPRRVLAVGEPSPATADESLFVSDVTDGLAVFEISGLNAATLIAMGTTSDPPADRAVRTLFGGVDVVLYRYGTAYRLHVDRPIAGFLFDWLRVAASVFGPAGDAA